MVGENNSGNKSILERIANKDGNEHFKVTNNQAKQGQNMGKSIHLHCYVCWKHLEPDGETAYKQTMFRCFDCRMPLCKKENGGKVVIMNM